MKKILALLLAVATLITSIGISGAMAEEEDYSYYLNFVQKLGIIEDVSAPKASVTRAQFASYIYNIVAGGSTQPTADRFFDEDLYDVLIEIGASAGAFDDVSESSEYYMEITTVNNLGIMKGTGNRIFSPDSEIPFNHAATALVRLLGYGYMVENNNYLAVAEKLGIYDGMAYNAADKITVEELARAFYNCFDIDVVKAEMKGDHMFFQEVEDVNIYQEFMDIYRVKGQLEKTPYASIYGDSKLSKDTVVVNGVSYTAESNYAFYDLIGRNVEIYYCETDDERNIVWGYETGYDEVITIPVEDFISFEKDGAYNRIEYYSGDREEEERIKSNAAMIKNGIYKASYSDDDFDFENGDITIIRPRAEQEFSIIIVNAYSSMKVTRVDSTNGVLYAQQYYNEDVKDYVLNEREIDAWRVQYYLADGTKTAMNSITVGMVIDVLENDGNEREYVKIIATNNIIPNATIKSIDTSDAARGTVFSLSDGQKVSIPTKYLEKMKAACADPQIGKEYNIALNSFGKIAYVETISKAAGTSFVYVVELRSDEFSEEYAVEYLNAHGEFVLSYIKSGAKVTRDTPTGRESFKMQKQKDFQKITLKDGGTPYSGVAQIRLDDAGYITEINLPVNDKNNRDNIFGTMFEKEEKRYNSGRLKAFENLVTASNVVIFEIDPTPESTREKDYKVTSFSNILTGDSRTLSAYNFNSGSAVANCVVITRDDVATADKVFRTDEDLYIITDIYQGIYEDEAAVMVRANTCGPNVETAEVVLPATGDRVVNGGLQAGTFFNKTDSISLKKGDIIYVETENGYIVDALLVYRIFPEAGEVNLYGTIDDDADGYSDGFWKSPSDPNYSLNYNTNPYAVGKHGVYDLGVATDYHKGYTSEGSLIRSRSNASHKFISAWAYDVELNEYLTYTTQPLAVKSYDEKYKDNAKNNDYFTQYITETICLPWRYITVNVDGRNISVRKGTVNDIITYKQAGVGCSELFIDTNLGSMNRLVIINRTN